jgi:hypothetical protein
MGANRNERRPPRRDRHERYPGLKPMLAEAGVGRVQAFIWERSGPHAATRVQPRRRVT